MAIYDLIGLKEFSISMIKRWLYRVRYMALGGLLGLGAPVGALAWRLLLSDTGPFWVRICQEWTQSLFFYNYMLVGTVSIFSVCGYLLGRKSDMLKGEMDAVSVLAITDGLTNVYNHRYLQEHLAIEIEEANRYKTPLACMMLDIDDFKRVNDTYGHPFGDLVLRRMAKLIRENTRHVDVVGRYGGEEFLVIMPHTTSHEALPIAERVRQAIAKHPFSYKNTDMQITISIGLADYPSTNLPRKDKGALLRAADEALYKAKAAGKNQTVIWQA